MYNNTCIIITCTCILYYITYFMYRCMQAYNSLSLSPSLPLSLSTSLPLSLSLSLSLKESHHICSLYNKLSTVLLQYEVLWLKQYRDRIDKTSSMCMSAPLLRLQDNEKMTKIVVNSDTGYINVLI